MPCWRDLRVMSTLRHALAFLEYLVSLGLVRNNDSLSVSLSLNLLYSLSLSSYCCSVYTLAKSLVYHDCLSLKLHFIHYDHIIASTAASMADFDLDFGMKNSYVPAEVGDGGQGQFGAVSPSDWRVPGTGPVGQSSYPGAADGGDEPWFSEAVSTVSLDLDKADATLKAFTKDAAKFKAEAFAKDNGVDAEKALESLVESMGYDKFLESSPGQLKKAWAKMNEKE